MAKKTINTIFIRFRGKFEIQDKLSDKDLMFLVSGASQEKKITDNQDGTVDIIYIVDILEGKKVVDKK